MLRIAIALLIVLGLGGNSATADAAPLSTAGAASPVTGGGDGAEIGDEPERPESADDAVAPDEAKPSVKSKGKSKGKVTANRSRRGKSRGRSRHKMSGQVVPETKLRAEAPPRPSGDLHLFNVSTREEAKVNIYNEDGSYNIDALGEVNRLFRCKRTESEKEIDPRLLVVLSHVHDHYAKARLELVSGYRNQRRTTSHHFTGTASDIRIPGVEPKALRAFVETLDAGGMGIGLYPRSKFVHIDVRPPPSYRWIDWSPPEPNAPDKRPPRGTKRKRLQS